MKKVRKIDLSQKETKWEYIDCQIILTSEEFKKLSQDEIMVKLSRNAMMRFQIAYPGAFHYATGEFEYTKNVFKYTKSSNLVMEILDYFKDLNWYRYRGYQPYLEKI